MRLRSVLTSYAKPRFVYRRNILHGFPVCERTMHRYRRNIRGKIRTSDGLLCRRLWVSVMSRGVAWMASGTAASL